MFFNTTEFEMIQDPSLMQRQLERCKFMLEFTNEALVSLYRTPLDPFSSRKVSVDAFGWAFAAASSRAFRSLDLIELSAVAGGGRKEASSDYGTGQVLIPLLDIASHSNIPNCRVVLNHETNVYELITLTDIHPGDEISIDYGPLSNEEFFGDYGFSVDDNSKDELMFKLDSVLIDTARAVMGQTLKGGGGEENLSLISDTPLDETPKLPTPK